MKRIWLLILRRLGQEINRLAGSPLPAGIQPAPAWTERERDQWMRFILSDTGAKMMMRLRAFEAANAIAGAKDVMHTAHSAGRSCGYSDCIQHMISLAHTCDAKAVKVEVQPTMEESEADLLERLSP